MNLQAILPLLFLLWLLAILLTLLRGDISWVWKIAVLLIFLFYLSWFWPETKQEAYKYSSNFTTALILLQHNLLKLLPFLLLLLWPVVLIQSYKSRSTIRSENILRNIVLLTLFYWLFWIATEYLHIIPQNWRL